jgi:adenine/guanine phosphoribosyltransferase-like PRPP-binding protein
VTATDLLGSGSSGPSWVRDTFGVELGSRPGRIGLPLTEAVGLALRRNPRRAHLLVSTLLGKHVPTDPRLVYGSGRLLGLLVTDVLEADQRSGLQADRRAAGGLVARALSAEDDKEAAAAAEQLLWYVDGEACAGRDGPADVAVLGFAETATALGHAVADSLRAPYLHSTRRPVAGSRALEGFEEEHSHAPGHLLLPERPELVIGARVMVLVDDELSTGRTVINTIRALRVSGRHERVVVAALVDVRSAQDRLALQAFAAEQDIRVDVVSLAEGRIDLPEGLGAAVAEWQEHLHPDVPGEGVAPARGDALADGDAPGAAPVGPPETGPRVGGQEAPLLRVDVPGLRDGARHGFDPQHATALRDVLRDVAARVAPDLAGDRVLVLGSEELMYAPQLLGIELSARLGPSAIVRSSGTTRSPVVVVDRAGYPIRTGLTFPAHDDPADGPGPRFAYNVAPPSTGGPGFSDVVLVVDDAAAGPALTAPGGLVASLRERTQRVQVVVLPSYRPAAAVDLPRPLRGPDFGTYPAEDVGWLLKDLSQVALEQPTAQREAAIQAGRAHYAQSLPVEFQPDQEYQQLFREALEASKDRLAHAVGVVAEQVLARRGRDVALVSLARAGTPVGILVRRWLAFRHGLDVPHYTMSIVRGRGIDEVALAWLRAHHDPADVMFVDGWTGKGAIAGELAQALVSQPGFSAELAVLADPGHCVTVFGTREDYLIPSACLNSTVSGLVSRTVLNAEHIGPGEFHGAKFYRELRDADMSGHFLDTVAGRFAVVAADVDLAWPVLAAATRAPDWRGRQVVDRIAAEFGITDTNLVKPGVGETTRVLLRRVPWKVLAARGAGAELAHIRVLAEQRGVPVEEVAGLPYRCVGLIRPSGGAS